MQMPPTAPEPFCAALLPDSPPATLAMADALQACTRVRTSKMPQPWWRAVLVDCGLDQSQRAVAGTIKHGIKV